MSEDTTTRHVHDHNDDDPEPGFEPDEFKAQQRTRVRVEPPKITRDEVLRSTGPKVTHHTQSCVMLGPARSGKTTLLTAIKRACDQPANDGLNLEFIPGEETARKIKNAINQIANRQQGHQATADVKEFPFEVHLSAKAPHLWSPPVEEDLYVVMSDGGGGFLLPSDDKIDKTFRPKLIETARTARSLILCVDISNPASTTLEKELAICFAEMSKLTPTWSTVHWTAKFWAWLRRKPVPQPRKRMRSCLNVDRFLLLLTQVDKLCHQLPQGIDRTVRFAEMIDPVEQARELLGVPVLKTIQNSLKPSAQFAVGVISAMGFHPRTGDPFADVDGTPLNLDSESGEDILRRWTPFGIRDAIYFLATGKCRGRVKQLHPSDLRAGLEPLEFSYTATSHKEA
ncbi:MAG TPA: hypothetical protein VJT15_13520 [Pyrinomonadaceae bacterium]|nr:hypothetical protein [Pyrinomonadaceae bacterium]